MRTRTLWIALVIVLLGSFAVLLRQGRAIDREKPPIPAQVVDPAGRVVFTGDDIRRGQEVWQRLGGQQLGSVWGHGAYLAPDWSADWLHREAELILDDWACAEGAASYADASPERAAALRARLHTAMRAGGYDRARDTVTLDPARAAAIEALVAHYTAVFRDGVAAYAIPAGTVAAAADQRRLAAFFFWTSWAAVTERPGTGQSYTQNFPHEPLVGNAPPDGALGWSIASVILLLAAIAGLIVVHARGDRAPPPEPGAHDPLGRFAATPSQRAVKKYFVLVGLLLVGQLGMGALTAHYGVEGDGFYGIDLAAILPYAVTRTWHTQLGIFWIATAWLGTGLFLAPLIGIEPPGQKRGVDLLFAALLVVVGGALGGTWAAATGRLGDDAAYWIGHQGWEYVDLGRVWQIALLAGLGLWLGLMLRALAPALRRRDERRPLLVLFVLSTVAIAGFYGAGLMIGRGSHMANAEYWRWWVVHLWVEGFFEVFATAAIAYLLVVLGLLDARRATPAVLFATIVFLGSGVLGTLHHLYFSATPPSVMALGAVFSALEVAPLTLLGFELWHHLGLLRARPWVLRYRWPVYFFVAVAFWNLVGAGLFGFLINPPIALYYMQGLDLTALHAHTALFGVYGLLGIGLALFCLRVLRPEARWDERWLKVAFWALNGGLAAMALLSLLPLGIIQTAASIEHGTWYARSAELRQGGAIEALRWLRFPGDVLFTVGAVAIALFFAGFGWRARREGEGA
ncbi:MAG TPA: nitric-oxide reductase large subunit [Kofleriaceae bacterium]|nr:nitric-oxide reductase large subunit [Kofleriaceae bacterium]